MIYWQYSWAVVMLWNSPLCHQLPKDAHILRFLRAREFTVERAREMLCHSLAWRKLHDMDRLLTTYEPPPVIDKYYSGGWHFHDKGTCWSRRFEPCWRLSCYSVGYLEGETNSLIFQWCGVFFICEIIRIIWFSLVDIEFVNASCTVVIIRMFWVEGWIM